MQGQLFAVADPSPLSEVQFPITTPFTRPDAHSKIPGISHEAHLLPSRTEAGCPGRPFKRESRRLFGVNTWSIQQ